MSDDKKYLDVYVVSWGGVGTTAFINFLKDLNIKSNTNSDIDIRGHSGDKYSSGIKHINNPNHHKLENYEIKKAIFVYDDVINSLLSLWKRGYQCDQVKKITNNRNEISKDWSLEDYVNNNQDLFEFEQFYWNWAKTKKKYPCLFVKGQQIYKHRFLILKFLNLPISTRFIKENIRLSNWYTDDNPDIRKGLYRIYGGFNDFICSQPDILLQKENSLIFTSDYSVSDTFSSRIKNPHLPLTEN